MTIEVIDCTSHEFTPDVEARVNARIAAAVAAERERWRATCVEALGWMESSWHRIDGEWGPCGKSLDQVCADGNEPEIAALRALLKPQR